MRITGGKARGIPLKTLARKQLRPATDRMRKAVYSSLGQAIIDKNVLDLFAGSGAYGLEAASRGASRVTLVERCPKQAACLQANLTAVLQSIDQKKPFTQIVTSNAFTWKPAKLGSFDWIFADPPYAILPQRAHQLFLRAQSWLKPSAASLLILEAPGEFDYRPTGWRSLRCFGQRGRRGRRGEPIVLVYTRSF